MTIRSKLTIVGLIPLAIALVAVLAILWTNMETDRAKAVDRTGDKITRSVFELNLAIDQYLRLPEERPKAQFLAEIESLELKLSNIKAKTEQERGLVNNMRQNRRTMAELFTMLIPLQEKKGLIPEDNDSKELLERLVAQLLANSRELVSHAIDLSRVCTERLDALQQYSDSFILGIILIFGTGMIVFAYLISRSILRPIQRLQKGTEKISGGELGFQVAMVGGDEIGQLSKAFNEMAKKLAGSYVSIKDLQTEIAERKRAEEELRKSRDQMETEVTERKKVGKELQSLLKFLEIANRHSDLNTLLQEFVRGMKELAGCEAVGIRLADEQGNIPYMAYQGFSRKFYETESPLSIKTDKCMCINVVKGTTDPGLPFYTEGGSFYMNGTTRFLATVSEEDKGQTRNVCNQTGYESVALIPIRFGNDMMGLIHLADREENRVPLNLVKLLEQAASALGVGVQRALAEEELSRNREWLRVTLTSIGDAIISTDTAGKITFINPVAQALTGWQPKEALGESIQTVFQIINEKTLAPGEDIVQRVLQEGSVVALANSTALITRAGQTIPIEDSAAPIKDREGKVIGVVLVFHDVTEKRRAREALLESEQKYSVIFDQSPFAIALTRMPEDILFSVNPAFLNLFEYSREEVAGKTSVDLGISDPDSRAQVASELQARGLVREFETVRTTKSGDRRALSLNLDWVTIGGEKYILTMIEDITERKQAENALRQKTMELQKMTENLEERVKERTTELANLSAELVSAQEKERERVSYDLHDNVWQSLLAIRFEIENLFIKKDKTDWEGLHKKSKEVTADLLTIVGKIRFMQGDLWPYVLDDIGLLATMDWYCREFEKMHSGITVEKQMGLEEAEVPVTVKLVIYRIMQETLTNAAQHSGATHIVLSFNKTDHRMGFAVKDNGIGFDPEETMAKRSLWGGLGLLSIKARTELSGGLFGVESAKGEGTIVRASWPI